MARYGQGSPRGAGMGQCGRSGMRLLIEIDDQRRVIGETL